MVPFSPLKINVGLVQNWCCNFSVHFEAQPKPEYGNIVWRVVKDNNNEVVLTVEEDDPKEAFNYIAYPIRQVSPDSEYEYEAKLTILNISKSERNYQHFLVVKTRF